MPVRYRVIVARGHDRREVEVVVSHRDRAVDAAKTAAAREFGWPYYEITILGGHQVEADETIHS